MTSKNGSEPESSTGHACNLLIRGYLIERVINDSLEVHVLA